MKLPGAVKTGVRGLALMPSVAAYESQKAQSFSQIGQAIGGAVDKIEQDRIKEQTRQVKLSMLRSQAEIENDLSGPTIMGSEIPKEIEAVRTTKEIINGVEQSTDKQYAMWEMKPRLYKNYMTKAVMNNAEKIDNDKARQEFIEMGLANIDVQFEKLTAASSAEQRKYNNEVLENDINNLVDEGNFDAALIMSNEITSPEVKGKYKRKIKAQKQNKLNEQYSANIEDYSNKSAKLARDGDLAAADALVSKANKDVDSLVDSGGLTQVQGDKIKAEMKREMLEQTSRRTFDYILDTQGVEAANDEITKLKWQKPEGWTPDGWDSYINSQQAYINREASKERASNIAAKNEATKLLNQYKTSVSLGIEVAPNEKLKVSEMVAGTDKQEEFDRVNRIAAFSVMDIQDRNKALKSAESGGLAGVNELAAMLQANNEINKLASDDGYSLGVKQGIIQQIELDPNDPLTFALKVDQAETLSEHYGVEVSPLSDFEADQLSASIDTMPIQEKIQLAQTLNESPSVWGQIAPKNQQVFSMAGATGDKNLMGIVFRGQELLKNKVVQAPSNDDYLMVTDEYLGDVYDPTDKAATIEAAKAHYAATAGNQVVFDETAWDESLAAVTGGISEINGHKLELPRGVDEDNFENFIDSFSPGDVETFGGVIDYTNEQAAEVIQDAKIKSIGSNEYVVITGVRGAGPARQVQALLKPNGEPFVLSFTPEVQAKQEAKVFLKAKTIESGINKLRGF